MDKIVEAEESDEDTNRDNLMVDLEDQIEEQTIQFDHSKETLVSKPFENIDHIITVGPIEEQETQQQAATRLANEGKNPFEIHYELAEKSYQDQMKVKEEDIAKRIQDQMLERFGPKGLEISKALAKTNKTQPLARKVKTLRAPQKSK